MSTIQVTEQGLKTQIVFDGTTYAQREDFKEYLMNNFFWPELYGDKPVFSRFGIDNAHIGSIVYFLREALKNIHDHTETKKATFEISQNDDGSLEFSFKDTSDLILDPNKVWEKKSANNSGVGLFLIENILDSFDEKRIDKEQGGINYWFLIRSPKEFKIPTQ